jgi:hypothetical protein
MQRFIHCLVILALALAAASPACEFISGKTIEICTADGLKLVSVPGDGDSSTPQHAKKNDCGFCFAQSHINKFFANSISIALLLLAFSIFVIRDARHIRHRKFSSFAARGPPLPI